MSVPTYYTLQNGFKIPSLGFGTFTTGEPKLMDQAIRDAIDVGYRHFDAAALYGNEPQLGRLFAEIFKEGKVKREDIFITSKLFNDQHRKEHVRAAFLKTLKELQLTYLDLYLIHFPISTKNTGPSPNFATTELDSVPLSETWAALEELVNEGLVRSIGISNFNVQLTLDLLSYAKIRPQVNQVEIHPLLAQTGLVKYLKSQNIVVSAYFPIGGHRPNDAQAVINNELVKKIADKHNKTPAQILLRWSLQRGLNPIVKSATPSRIKENFDIFNFELSADEIEEITSLDRNERLNGDKQIPIPPLFS